MTQLRLPLFTTGIPQIVNDELTILDLRDDRQNDQTRLVTLWVNYSSLDPAIGDDTTVNLWIQQGSDSPEIITTALLQQAGQPLKLLSDFVLRGNVRLYLAGTSDYDTGDVVVAWGYYSIASATPRGAFELRPLQPDPQVIPASMGMPVVVHDETTVLHTVLDDHIDEIRLEAIAPPLVNPPGSNFFSAVLYFGDEPTAPLPADAPGYISLFSPGTTPSIYSVSRTSRYFDGIPFIGAGQLKLTTHDLAPPITAPTWVLASFTRTT